MTLIGIAGSGRLFVGIAGFGRGARGLQLPDAVAFSLFGVSPLPGGGENAERRRGVPFMASYEVAVDSAATAQSRKLLYADGVFEYYFIRYGGTSFALVLLS